MPERGIIVIAQQMAELQQKIDDFQRKTEDLKHGKKDAEDQLEALKPEVLAFSQAGSACRSPDEHGPGILGALLGVHQVTVSVQPVTVSVQPAVSVKPAACSRQSA